MKCNFDISCHFDSYLNKNSSYAQTFVRRKIENTFHQHKNFSSNLESKIMRENEYLMSMTRMYTERLIKPIYMIWRCSELISLLLCCLKIYINILKVVIFQLTLHTAFCKTFYRNFNLIAKLYCNHIWGAFKYHGIQKIFK